MSDFHSNPFMKLLQTNYSDILHQAASEDHIICLPQPVSLKNDVTLDDIETHILQPNEVVGEYITLNGKMVVISGNNVYPQCGFKEKRRCRILVTEDMEYKVNDEQQKKISLLHLSRPLAGGIPVPDEMSEMDKGTFRRYTAIMRAYPVNELVFYQLDRFIELLLSQEPDILLNDIQQLPQLFKSQWESSVIQLYQGGTFSANSIALASSSHYLQIEQVVESYIMEKLHHVVFTKVHQSLQQEEESLAKVIYSMRHYTHSDIGIETSYQCQQEKAIEGLLLIANSSSPLEILLCLKSCVEDISVTVTEHINSNNLEPDSHYLTTDRILDQLLYILVQVFVKTEFKFPIISYLKYVNDFHFVNSNSTAIGFSLANFEVAIEWFMQRRNFCSQIENTEGLEKRLVPVRSILEVANQYNAAAAVNQGSKCFSNCEEETSSSTLEKEECQIVILGKNQNDDNNDDEVAQHKYHLKSRKVGDEGWNITQICCSQRYFAAVDGEGSMYTWGLAQGGRLGHGRYTNQINILETPTKIPSLEGVYVLQVACGAYHVLATCRNGDVYGWGDNQYSQLGVGNSKVVHLEVPHRIKALQGIGISAVACGSRHSLALTSQGQVYSWGCNDHGQLGRKMKKPGDFKTPMCLLLDWSGHTLYDTRRPDRSISSHGMELDEAGLVLGISCGSNHSLAVCRDGSVFTWGNGAKGRLGHGSHSDEMVPKQLMALSDPTLDIVQASGGSAHSVFLARNGIAFACGWNRFGQLGIDLEEMAEMIQQDNTILTTNSGQMEIPSDKMQTTTTTTTDVLLVPLAIKYLSSHRVLSISCGKDHTAAISSMQKVFLWGYNLNQQCGMSDPDLVKLPMENPNLQGTMQLSCGDAHTMVVPY